MAPEEESDLDDLLGALDDVAAEERAVRAEADRLSDAPGSDRVESVLEAAMAGEAPTDERTHDGNSESGKAGPNRWSRAWGVTLLAASLLIVAISWQWRTGDVQTGPGPSDVMLHIDGFNISYPKDPVGAFDRIEWRYPSPTGRSFVLLVSADGSELLRLPGLLETVRLLTPKETASWPNQIEIVVEAYDESGSFLGSANGSAERSSD